MMML
jgi:hypothetical protein